MVLKSKPKTFRHKRIAKITAKEFFDFLQLAKSNCYPEDVVYDITEQLIFFGITKGFLYDEEDPLIGD